MQIYSCKTTLDELEKYCVLYCIAFSIVLHRISRIVLYHIAFGMFQYYLPYIFHFITMHTSRLLCSPVCNVNPSFMNILHLRFTKVLHLFRLWFCPSLYSSLLDLLLHHFDSGFTLMVAVRPRVLCFVFCPANPPVPQAKHF